MKKFYFLLLLALTMTSIGARAAKEVYSSFNKSKGTLTYYYDDQRSARSAKGETTILYEQKMHNASEYGRFAKVAIIDESMREAHLTSTKNMFAQLNIEKIQNIENLITDEVVNMDSMFYNCDYLTELDLSGFNTDKVTGMGGMFYYCLALKELDFSEFNTANVTNMAYMFYNCISLTTLDLSYFNTAKVTNMRAMFKHCIGLKFIDLNSFDISKVEDINLMFTECVQLATIHCEQDWSIYNPNQEVGLFAQCKMLYGDKGTECDAVNNVSLQYARLDGLDGKPGYFSSEHPSLPSIVYSVFKDNTLTYFYDNLFGKQEGTVEKYVRYTTRMKNYSKDIQTVKIDASMKNTRLEKLVHIFQGYDKDEFQDLYLENLTEIQGLDNLVTDEMTSMFCAFDGCSSLKSLDLSSFNTSKVANMYGMFLGCSSLKSLDMSEFNTSNVTDMSKMFRGCSSLESLDLSKFNTSNVTDMSEMFYRCSSLKSLDLSKFDFTRLDGVDHMFERCNELTTILCSWDLSKCVSITNYELFGGCGKLKGGNGTTYIFEQRYIKYARPDGVGGKPGYFTAVPEVYTAFDEETGTLTYYYDDQRAAHDGICESYKPSNGLSIRFEGYADKVKKAVIDESFKNIRLTSLANMFYGGNENNRLTELKEIEGLGFINCQDVTDLVEMFCGCSSLKSIDLSSLHTTDKVTSIYGMFTDCYNLESINLAYLNTDNVTNMAYLFKGCKSLKTTNYLDFQHFNTAKVTDMRYMFADCSSLETLDLRLLHTDQATDMTSMFMGCSSLKSINLLSFNTANVTKMTNMFRDCYQLTTLNLCSFNTTRVTDMRWMFSGCTNLKNIYCNQDWNINVALQQSDNMFSGCTSLTGNKGTACNGTDNTDITYACPDGRGGKNGYFTDYSEIYTAYDNATATLTYYYDKKRLNTTAVTELYDPTDLVTVRFKGYCDKVQTVQIDESMMDAELTSMQNMFFGGGEYDEKSNYVRYPLTNAKKIDGLEYLNTEKVTDMSGMFSGCASVESLDLASFNTDNVKDMRSMFSGCTALTTIRCKFYLDESEKLEQSEKMFKGCTSLVGENGTKCDGVNNIDKTYARPDKENAPGYFTTINEAYTVFDEATATLTYYYDDRCLNRKGTVEMYTPLKKETVLRFEGYAGKVKKAVIDQSFKNAKLKSLAYMFCGGSAKTFLTALESVEGLENINCDSKVTDMKYMFMGCYSLQQLDATLISTAGVKNMQGMFFDCPALTELNVNGFDISSATNMTSMFANCTSLATIWCKSDWNISSIDSHDMFYNCPSLKGGSGTAYNENHIDNAYARTDKSGNEQGYFTRPSYPNGLFTVSEDGAQMMFSQGNLQFNAMQGTHQCADGTTQQGTWRFAINQWESAGMDNENISDSYNGWIDLFGWGTSGWDNGAKEYQPWAASKDYNDYLYSKDGLKGDYAYADWGVYNQIEDHQPGTWRTLSVAEWRYILNNRTAALGRRGGAIVNGVNGYILLPDDWEIPSGMTFNYGSGWNKNVYNRRDWNRMEMAGAIFLPAAGYREGTTMNGHNGIGYYYTNLPYGYASTNYFFFINSDESLSNGTYSSYGLSVRLVRIPEDAPEYTLTVAVEGKGTVTGGGTFPKGTEVALTATPDENYVFSKWSDGSTDNPRYIQLTEDLDITAIFIEKSTGGSDDNFGTFSVGANKTVTFSPGNLQYQASTGTWRFAENEWDYVGNNNAKISSTYDGWIDLFGWGTGNAPTLATYLGDDYADFVDWGTNTVGADAPDTWRTLTSDEWGYLINTRADAEQKYGAAKVNEIGGLVILPDMWTLPSNCNFKAGMIPDGKYSWYDVVPENTYTAEQWKAMQEAGAVFLPAAGYRGGTSVSYEVGRYWSSDPTSDIYSRAYNLNFKAYDLEAEAENGRYFGGSVRLVKDFAQEQPEELEPLPGNETTTFDFSLIGPDGSKMLGVTLDAKDNYNKEEGRIEVASTNTAAEVDAKLDKAFSGTASLKPFLPGTITFELPAGEGTIEIDCQTMPGYTLNIRIAEYGTAYITSTIEQALRSKATVNYSVTQNTYVVIYLEGAPAGSALARIARSAAEENAGAYIWSITVIPDKTPTGIDTTDIHQSANAKFVKDGILYIRHNGRVYTAQGAEAK